MANVVRALHELDDVLGLEGPPLERAVARQLGYRLGRELSFAERPFFSDRRYDDRWFAWAPQRGSYEPFDGPTDFSTNPSLVQSLPLPFPTERYEDWIHTEMGPDGRWIVRLMRLSRAGADYQWNSKELYVADRDDDPIPLATAYGRAWLISHYTWPESEQSDASKAA